MTRPMKSRKTKTTTWPITMRFNIKTLPPAERRGWTEAGDMYMLEFFSSSIFPDQRKTHEMAKSAAQIYGLRNEPEKTPTTGQIEAVHPSR